MNGIDKLFYPNAVAVCGSVSPGKLGAVLIERLLDGGFERVYAANPKAMGCMSAPGYARVQDIRDNVELVVIASPAATVKDVIEDAGRAGVKAAVIISSGFSEAGEHDLEAEAMAAAKRYGIRCTGPNCAGLINTKARLFPTLEAAPKPGRTAIISQSGAVGGVLMDAGIAVSKFVSYGNGADLKETELLSYMAEDPDTDNIAMYVENIRNGREFMDALVAAVKKKPVVIIKSGRTQSGGRAALSHTGSMAGQDAVYEAAFNKCGAIRAYSAEELKDIIEGLGCKRKLGGKDIAVITNSGGPGVMCVDRLEELGMACPAPDEEQLSEFRTVLPPFAGLANPIDLTAQGDAKAYKAALITALKGCDAAIALYVGTPYLEALPVAKAVSEAAALTDKPVFAVFSVGRDIDEARAYLLANGVPLFASGERAALVLSRMVERPQGRLDIGTEPQRLNKAALIEPEAMDLLEREKIPVPKRRFCRSAAEAVEAAGDMGFPVCVKVVSPAIIHKSDVGGVRLNIDSTDGVRAAFADMAALGGADFAGVMVYPMLKAGTEAIMGLTRDHQFGPVAAFGLGGIYTEVFRDIALGVAPLSREEALCMIGRVKAYKLLSGVRGARGADMGALADMLVKLSELMFRYEDIREVDLNPVFAYENGAVAADVRIIMEDTK